MKKLMLTSALALCAPAAFAAPAAGKVSCTPEQTGMGSMVNTTVCEVKGASLDEAYRALYRTKNKHIKSYLHDLKLPCPPNCLRKAPNCWCPRAEHGIAAAKRK